MFLHSIVCIFLFIFPAASREGTTCSFADPAFVVYSSVASFYVPFIVTLLVYAQICVVLRRRGRRTAPPRRHGLHTQGGAEAGEGHRHRKVDSQIWTSPESNCFWLIFETVSDCSSSLFSLQQTFYFQKHQFKSSQILKCHILKSLQYLWHIGTIKYSVSASSSSSLKLYTEFTEWNIQTQESAPFYPTKNSLFLFCIILLTFSQNSARHIWCFWKLWGVHWNLN